MKVFSRSLVCVLAAACATDVVDVDRTQPNRTEKALFDGEWYFRATIIETDFNQGFLFEGLEGELERVRWQITIDQLVAYRSYEQLRGAEDGNGDPEFHGNPVAVFAITSHFDVKRDYNAATGEQSNVISENTSDRPWYERDFMRVDWSQNLLMDGYKLEDVVGMYSGAPFYVQGHEPDNAYRPEITKDAINVVGNYLLMSDVGTCYDLFGYDVDNCSNSEVKAKLSFLKVQERDYEPLYYPDNIYVLDADGRPVQDCSETEPGDCDREKIPVFERFGFFRTKRLAYDNERQWTRDGRLFLGNRWNIWKGVYDKDGNIKPAHLRKPGKVLYHTNVDFPADHDVLEATQTYMSEWDEAFRDTVFQLKLLGDATTRREDIRSVFEFEKNSCNVEDVAAFAAKNGLSTKLAEHGIGEVLQGNLKRACAVLEWYSKGTAQEFTWQKEGDLRHSFLHWVDTPQNAGPLGYGPSAADPVTGEIISANANIYGGAVDEYAAYAADVVALMNGDVTVDDITEGENIRAYMSRDHSAPYGVHSAAKMAARRERDRGQSPFAQGVDQEGHAGGSGDGEADSRSGNAKLERLLGSAIEKELLINDDLRRAMLGPNKFQPGQGVRGGEDFSPMQWGLEGMAKRRNDALLKAAEHSIDMPEMAAWADSGMMSLADSLKGKSWEEVYALMRREIYRSVMAHEVGHTLGLRHNFMGSLDALNYKPEFWSSFNTSTGVIDTVDPVKGLATSADRYRYSSIMDYDARFYADSVEGIGPYDKAALRFGYGTLVEVFDQSVVPPLFFFDYLTQLHNYQDLPKILSGKLSCATDATCHPDLLAAFAAYQQNDMNTFNKAFVSFLKNAVDDFRSQDEREADPENVVPVVGKPENLWKRSYMTLEDVRRGKTAAFQAGSYPQFIEVPYKFCTDQHAGYESWIDCKPYDKGATYKEVTDDRMERYSKYYFFSNFKRDRVSFNDSSYMGAYLNRLLTRYFLPMSATYRNYLYGESSIGTDLSGNNLTLNDFDLGKDWEAAAMDGLNYLTQILEQPEPGTYCLGQDGEGNAVYAQADADVGCDGAESLTVPLGVGKYYYTNWTDEYYYKATRIGTFYDKWAALWSLTSNDGVFYRNFSDLLDSGAFSLSYWRTLQPELLDLFSSAFLGGSSRFAWRHNGQDIVPAPVVDIYDGDTNYDSLPRIESASSWTLRYFSVVLPMARFNSMYDYTRDFSGFSRVCLEGYRDCLDYELTDPDSGDVVTVPRYVDPFTGYSYLAPPTLDDTRALGKKMVDEAQHYADTVYAPAKQEYDLAVASGTSSLQLDRLQKTLFRAERGVNERTSFLDIIRQVALQTEYGD